MKETVFINVTYLLPQYGIGTPFDFDRQLEVSHKIKTWGKIVLVGEMAVTKKVISHLTTFDNSQLKSSTAVELIDDLVVDLLAHSEDSRCADLFISPDFGGCFGCGKA